MKKFTKIALVFVFTIAVGIAGISLFGGFNKDAPNDAATTLSSLNAGPTVGYADDTTWSNNLEDKNRMYGGGNGSSAATAYEISTAEDLALMAYRVNMGLDPAGKFYKLTNNIDLSEHYWMPIGNYMGTKTDFYEKNMRFDGYFDGENNTISNMYIGNPDTSQNANLSYAGLFGNIKSATIKNLNINCFIENTSSGSVYIGGIAGYAENVTIDNCTVSGKISSTIYSGSSTYMGGLVGCNITSININNCINFADLSNKGSSTATYYAAGIVANSNKATITKSCNFGDINFKYCLRAAGLVANTPSDLTINNCFNVGNITFNSSSSTSDAGGLVGYAYNGKLTISNSYNTGNISVTGPCTYAGGLVSDSPGSTDSLIKNCYSAGTIVLATSSTSYIGIFAGRFTGTITNCYYSSTASAKYNGGSSTIAKVVGNRSGSGNASGKTQAEMTTDAFLNLLNGQGSDWISGGDGNFPTLKIEIREHLIITFIYYNESNEKITEIVYQPVNGDCKLPKPPRYSGNEFVGWFADENDQNSYQITSKIKLNEFNKTIKTFYAIWKPSTISYDFKIELYDCDEIPNAITDPTTISELISGTSFTFDQYDRIYGDNGEKAIFILKNTNSPYRFDKFEINGIFYYGSESLTAEKYNASYFAQENNTEPIIIKAYFMRQFKLSFKAADNTTLFKNENGKTYRTAFVTIETTNKTTGSKQVKTAWFEDFKFDNLTNVKISITPDQGYSIKSVSPSLNFTLKNDTDIKIEIGTSPISLSFKCVNENDEDLLDISLPYLQSGKTEFTTFESTSETILVNKNSDYTLLRYELFLDGDFIQEYHFIMDEKDCVNNLNILELLSYKSSAEKITIKAIYKRIASLSFSYKDGSTDKMGEVAVFKDGKKINLVNGKSDDIIHGDIVIIKLKPNAGYMFVDKYGFNNGEKEITIDGQMKIDIGFESIIYAITVDNANSMVNSTARINENIIVEMIMGFGSQLEDYSLKINKQEIDKKFIKTAGNSLIITLDSEFISKYGADAAKDINLSLNFNTKLSTLFIAGIGGGGAIIIAAIILIIFYMLALQKRKLQLKKAEEEHKLGMARLSISDSIKNMRGEE